MATHVARYLQAAIMTAAVMLAAFSASAQNAASPAMTPPEVERIVRDYLRNHPEIVIEAIEAYKTRQEQAQRETIRKVLAERQKDIRDDPGSPVGGNPDGDVTVVEFFDYRCGYCKKVHPATQELLEKDGKVRFVFKEWPILGQDSVFAARAALASRNQGKYLEFHDALMGHRGALAPEQVMGIAAGLGMDIKKLQADMRKPEVDAVLRRNFELAEALGINGTPTFVIGDQVVNVGTLDGLQSAVRQARDGS